MNSPEDRRLLSLLINSLILLLGAVIICLGLLFLLNHPELFPQLEKKEEEQVQDDPTNMALALGKREIVEGYDAETGFIAANGYEQVIAHCTRCHSSKLVLQNRATREGWEEMIRWMQASQKLWDLGEAEKPILDYLATNYGPLDSKGRRSALVVEEWYRIK